MIFQGNVLHRKLLSALTRVSKFKNEPPLVQHYSKKSSATSSRANSIEKSAPKKEYEDDASVVWNPCNIQMIPDNLYNQIFTDSFRRKEFDEAVVGKCRQHLEAHSLWGETVNPMTSLSDLVVPQLQGEDLDDHFRNIALQQTFKYRKLMNQLQQSTIPVKPTEWQFTKGWTKYLNDGSVVAVPFPGEDALVFDVEVCVPFGDVPILACALSPDAWYSWCSDTLILDKDSPAPSQKQLPNSLDDLIPLETTPGESITSKLQSKEKIIVGHNVCYDRARIKEQYFLGGSKTRFIDTMSLHISISGITSYQRALKLTAKPGLNTIDSSQLRKFGVESTFLEWNSNSALNNLADVYKLYCNETLHKEARDIFVKGNIQDIRREFQNLFQYCSNDVEATKRVYEQLLPMFFERFPHPVTLAGTLEMGTTFLPINLNWKKYIEKSENAFKENEFATKSLLMLKADEALELLEGERYKQDPWLWDLDWKVTKPRKSKSSPESQPQKNYPNWYRKLLYKKDDPDYIAGPAKISTSMQIVPKLLRLTWLGFPLHHSRKGGWGFLIERPNLSEETLSVEDNLEEMDDDCVEEKSLFPFSEWQNIWKAAKSNILDHRSHSPSKSDEMTSSELLSKSEQSAELKDFIQNLQALNAKGIWARNSKSKGKKTDTNFIECSPHPNCLFIPLPHKDGPSNHVGNPLAKDFLSKIEEGILTSSVDHSVANKVVILNKMTSYWKNNRDRILGQMTVWLKSDEVKDVNDAKNFDYGVILPQVAVSGTLTRRAVEPTWMTASNAYKDRIGSELKGMIQAPPSFSFVGADVDSQELWIASIIGDASFSGIHGSTALGWMTLQGDKSAGTDMHSKTASLIGIGRDQAKVLNYARIYGAGVSFAERLLTQFNKQLNSVEAKSKAKSMYKMTKGERRYLLNEEGRKLANEMDVFRNREYQPFTRFELRSLLDFHIIPTAHFMEFVEQHVWDGGTESHMFNRLEQIAQDECPQTPFLGCSISRSLTPSVVHNDFMTSRVNWVVQSSAVDYLHLMITCMRWLTEKYNIHARFSISVHDEVRYLVKEEDRYRAALALQITNLLTRAFCAHQLGMKDLPMSIAFFSCVDIDKVLRKEVTQDSVTPSNPDGLSKGYGIPVGEGLTIKDVLEITKGSLEA